MNSNFVAIILTVIFAVVTNCSDSEPPEKSILPQTSQSLKINRQLRVVFKWPGDDFASKQDLETRDKIEKLIAKNGLGHVIRSGTGMGWMDLIVELENKSNAQAEIEKIIKETAPDSKFSFEKLP